MTAPTQNQQSMQPVLTPVQQAQLDLTNRMTKRTDTTPLYMQNQQAYVQTYGSSTPDAITTPSQTIPQSVWTDRLQNTQDYGTQADTGAAQSVATVKAAKTAADLARWQDQVKNTQQGISDSFAAFQRAMLTKYPVASTTYTPSTGGWTDANGNPISAHQAAVINNNINHGLNGDGTPKITNTGNDNIPAQKGQYVYQSPLDAQIAAWARQAGWAENLIPTVIGIAQAESSRNNNATHPNPNGSTDYGLMQINTVHRSDGGAINANFFTGGGWKDPVQNLAAALQIYKAAGNSFKDWVTFQNGDYQGYHPAYTVAKDTLVPNVSNVGGNISAGTSGLRAQIVSKGLQYLGTPYVYAGNSLTQGVDCSGLVQQLYLQFHMQLPRTAQSDSDPADWGSGDIKGKNVGYMTSKDLLDKTLWPGDLITFKGTGSLQSRGVEYGHVAIYIGNGKILESPDVGLTVRTRDLRPSEYASGNMRGIHLSLPGDNAQSGATGRPVQHRADGSVVLPSGAHAQ